jgi:hypothetical protein
MAGQLLQQRQGCWPQTPERFDCPQATTPIVLPSLCGHDLQHRRWVATDEEPLGSPLLNLRCWPGQHRSESRNYFVVRGSSQGRRRF